jgi:hypothetical protein
MRKDTIYNNTIIWFGMDLSRTDLFIKKTIKELNKFMIVT